MAIEKTFSIVKPNAVEKNNIGKIIDRFESKGLRVSAAKFTKLSKEKAEGFYMKLTRLPKKGRSLCSM